MKRLTVCLVVLTLMASFVSAEDCFDTFTKATCDEAVKQKLCGTLATDKAKTDLWKDLLTVTCGVSVYVYSILMNDFQCTCQSCVKPPTQV
jgi:hypothetical protein